MGTCYIMLDVGGTRIKAGCFSESGHLLGTIRSFDAKAREGRDRIFENLALILREMIVALEEREETGVLGIGMAFPGPFDYERGISRMKGLDKYDAIYGLPVRDHVMPFLAGQKGVLAADCPFHFLHDVEAFGLGVCTRGAAAHCQRVMCLCMGTGAGSAFAEKGRILKSGEGVPENGWIYGTPFKEGIIDDYLSVRGLKRLTLRQFEKGAGERPWEMCPEDIDGAALYQLAAAGNIKALNVWEAFGMDAAAAAVPFLDSFHPDSLVLGGQITKSFAYFGKALERACEIRNISVYLEPDTSLRAMEGLYATWNKTMEGTRI